MDPTWYQSVLGVALASVAVAQFIKKSAVDIEYVNRIPLVVYVFLLSALGTWFAHSQLNTLEGDLVQLITDAVTAALLAVGGFEAVSNIAKPLASTGQNVPRNGFGWPKTILVFSLVGFTAAGCATRGGVQLSPEGTLAVRGNQLVSALRSVTGPAGSSPLEVAVANKLMTVAEAVQVAEVIKQTMVYAQDLATVLKVVDEAKTETEREAGLKRAAALVQQIQAGLQGATLKVGTEGGRKAVLDALSLAASILLTVGSVFPTVS